MRTKQMLAAFMVALTVMAMPIGAAPNAGGVDWGSDVAPQPEIPHTATKAVHDMEWGATHEDARKYENDNGDVVKREAEVNTSADNPYSFIPTDVNFSDAGAFPHNKDSVSALDATEWTTGGANSTKISTSDVETAPGVAAVQIATDGSMASGDVAYSEFSNFSVTSDVDKRYLSLMLDVGTLDSGTVVEVRVQESDGDYKVAEINGSRSSGEDWIAGATGEGYVYQRQFGKMTTLGSGDGTMSSIDSVQVRVIDGDASVDISALNVEKMGAYDLGTEKVDTDGDGDLEETSHTEHKTAGSISVYSLETLGSAFDSADIHSLNYEAITVSELAGSEDIKLELNQSDTYPGYHGTMTLYVRMGLESAYDLSYTSPVLEDTQSVTEDRVISVETAEGVSEDTAFSDISDSSWSDQTGSYTGQGAEITLDNTVQPGTYTVIKYQFKLTEDQFDAIEATTGGGGGGATSGGLGNIPLIGGILVVLMGALRKFGG